MTRLVTVVPCYQEARRLDGDTLLKLVSPPAHHLLLVNDGSTDDTLALLQAIQSREPGRVDVLNLERNQGKGAAVRAGLLQALESGATLVGYYDADQATPVSDMLRLYEQLEVTGANFAMGSRVALLGRTIERTPARHYLGRVFATAASLALKLPVYDTQCGAKALRADAVLRQALAAPFTSRWVFDVEFMMRLLKGGAAGAWPAESIIEVPLQAWRDVRGSTLRPSSMVGAAIDLARLAAGFRQRP